MLLIDTKDERAARWYESYGVLQIPKSPLSLVLSYAVFIVAMRMVGAPILWRQTLTGLRHTALAQSDRRQVKVVLVIAGGVGTSIDRRTI